MKLIRTLEKSKEFWFLLSTSIFFFLLRLPSFFEPYWYGDEGIYQTIGIAIESGKLLYRDIWDNKPPLLYVLYSMFSGDQFALRFISFLFGLFSIIIFYFLCKKLFLSENNKNLKPVFLITFIYSFLFGIPLLEGNIANAENFMIPIILLSAYLVLNSVQKFPSSTPCLPAGRVISLSGFLLSIAFLFKIVAVFDMAAFFLFIFFIRKQTETFSKSFVRTFPFILGTAVPVILTAFFFLIKGDFLSFFKASFIQNVGYVGYGNQFIIPQGFLLVKLLFLSLFVLFLFYKKSKIKPSCLFILLWFSFSLFNAFFSQRPYTHYVLVVLPSFLLFAGCLFFIKETRKLLLILIIAIIILITNSFHYYGKTFFYYINFINFISGDKSYTSYLSFFDRHTPIDYQIVQFINNHAKAEDNIFIWGNNAQVYKLTNKLPPGRYTVAYHMTYSKESLAETEKAFDKVKPKYIIAVKSSGRFPFKLTNYLKKIIIGNETIYEKNF